ncbi:MAG: 50S ribosomal protein L6 [Candidatus Kariarchaeaceae archaeon]
MPYTLEHIVEVPIPEEVTITQESNKTIKIKGPKGSLERTFGILPLDISIDNENKSVKIITKLAKSKRKALVGTIAAHIRNMIIGVTEGFYYHLRVVYSHFPMTVSVVGKEVKIDNLYGGKEPKIIKILGDSKVVVKEGDVMITGPNIEHVSQTAATLQEICKLRGKRHKSPKTFMDGVYVSDKGRGSPPS